LPCFFPQSSITEAVAFEYQSEKVAEEVDEYDDEIESDDDDDVEPGSKYEPRNEYSVETDYSYNLCTRSGSSLADTFAMFFCPIEHKTSFFVRNLNWC
jgi:hypothetical protein